MKTARSDLVIMPNSEQAEHPRRECAMNSQMRPDNAMPIFHGTTGAHGLIPGSQKARGACAPSGANTLQQVLAGWTKDGPTQPGPRQQSDRLRSQDSPGGRSVGVGLAARSEEHTSELQSPDHPVS